MSRHLRAEWTKLRTTPGTGWLLLAVVVLTAGVSAAVAAAVTNQPFDVPRTALAGVVAGQAVVAVLAVLMISGEYGTGMIRTTLTAMPRRGGVLAAKAALLTGLTLAAGTVAVLGSVAAGRLLLPGGQALSLTGGPVLRAAAGSVLYLVLVGLLSLGVAAAVRDQAAAAGVVLGLLYLLALMTFLIQDADWQRFFYRLSPMNAGLTVQATAGLQALPLSPWAGLGVLAAWAAAALTAGGLLLKHRDA
ncbi:ABC transporter permease subunit [Nonomuraea sp. SBT364]|uniref:ABC transporter permease subunit n=1 Tax=Nonomuraea sp. SBT364 TaxID=1580530 RepID=UPI00066E62FA|nr:ABC transporter permease subunit [Nonomuraea sp. SBT364]